LLDDSAIQAQDKQIIRNLVEKKDLVELSRCLEKLPINDGLKETIARLPTLHGGLDVLKSLPYIEKSRNAVISVEELMAVYAALKSLGVEEHILVDMGVLRGLDYYTGVVFEGFSPELGYGLLGGGRYDKLLSQFGFPCPATGFALGMDRLALVLKNQEEEPTRYIVGGTNLQGMVQKADELRKEGKIVELDVEGHSRVALHEKLAGRPHYNMIYLDAE
jgi:ATP phosphoribosyltransferase regulatory subunit